MPVTYEILATTTISGTPDIVAFSSISQSYTDLRLVANFSVSSVSDFGLRLNGSGSNYAYEDFFARTGNNPVAVKGGGEFYFDLNYGIPQGTANSAIVTWDILQYASTTMNKSVLYDRGYQSGVNTTNSSQRLMGCGLWQNTAAVTSVSIINIGNNFANGGTVTLFGILKA
jgi:hypothetical protein